MSPQQPSWSDHLFTPQGSDGQPAWLLWLDAASDLLISLAFIIILLLLIRTLRKRSELRLNASFVCFAVFGIAAALMHAVAALNVWHLHYQFEAIIKLIAALSAIPAAILLTRLVLEILSLPSHKQVSETNEALLRANRELEAFTASVSHDLRAPLSTIAGQAGLLEMSLGTRASPDDLKRLHRIQGGTKQMAELIDALLALSRLSRYTLHHESIDATSLAQSIIAELQQRDGARHVTTVIAPGMQVYGDRRLITNVLSNLLSNAWKFTARTADARIEVGQSKDGAMSTLYVRDNGAGFDMAYSHKLFQPFQRLHSQADFSGTGIGLATVARIIDRHGGRIWAEGKAGAGATFYFTMRTSALFPEPTKTRHPLTQPNHDRAPHVI